MTLPYTYVAGTKAKAGEVNANEAKLDTQSPPIGAILPWAKTLAGVPALPAAWVECNGQVLSDVDSPLNGDTIPNLNASGGGTQRFLRGATASGGVGGAEAHVHQVTAAGGSGGIPASFSSDSCVSYDASGNAINSNIATSANHYTTSVSTLPSYYEVVFIMRVK